MKEKYIGNWANKAVTSTSNWICSIYVNNTNTYTIIHKRVPLRSWLVKQKNSIDETVMKEKYIYNKNLYFARQGEIVEVW